MSTRTLTSRRLFFCKAGAAALSAPLAVAAAEGSAAVSEDSRELRTRLDRLESANAIAALNDAYARQVNARAHGALAALFVNPAHVPIDEEVRALSVDPLAPRDVIEIAADGATASARIQRNVELQVPIAPSCTLVEMARQQGGGVVRRMERAVLELAYARPRGVWKIAQLHLRRIEPGPR